MTLLKFANDVSSVSAARRFVRDALDDAGFDADDATLLISELASNVVQHAGTDFDVVVMVIEATVRVEIHDGLAVSEAFRDLISQPPVPVDVSSPSGRGLFLLKSCGAKFGFTDKGHEGKAIWFEIERRPS